MALERPVSFLWSIATATARRLTDRGMLQSRKLDSFVISVGNIQAGGAGKTPLVAQIAREAMDRGKSVCILTRGYGRAHDLGVVIRPESAGVLAHEVGDEAALLHDLVPSAWIGVGSNRVTQFENAMALKGSRFDVTVLDDGFQHWKIKKDREILAVTSRKAGEVVFRDFESALDRSDLVVWTKGEERPEVLRTLRKPWAKIQYRYREFSAQEKRHSYWLVSAIADAEFFKKNVEDQGLKISKEVRFSDHAEYTLRQVQSLTEEAKSAKAKIAMTGKDWVKWRAFSDSEVLVLEPDLVFVEGYEAWEKTLWN